MQEYTENDWKLFRERIAGWQESFIEKLNREYLEILNSDTNPAEKFWNLEERITMDKKKAGVLLEIKRSYFIRNIISLINEGVIVFEDIEDFSDVLKETVHFILEK